MARHVICSNDTDIIDEIFRKLTPLIKKLPERQENRLKCVARVLLPEEISEGTKLAYEMFQYSLR